MTSETHIHPSADASNTVIASEAKQSMPPRKKEWIASAFAR